MTVKEIMERSGITETGRAIAYIKDALDEMALMAPTHVKLARLDLVEGKRFYRLPNEAVRVLDIRCKDHDNDSGLFRSIPRTIHEPLTEDTDGI
tara:strand:+ start:7765 stop:8046 length:282 start_codon:yes stop_codon:yes gene_type:complete